MIWRALWTCTARLALCPTYAAPLAFIISAFRNRQRLMDYIFQKAVPWLPSNAVTAGSSCLRTAPPAWKSSPNATYSVGD